MTHITALSIPEVKLITPPKFGDHRGYFSEVFKTSTLKDSGIDVDFIQDNQSFSAQAGTIRGLHFQNPPFAQAKLVRVVRGSIWDVAVDIRKGSPSYGQAAYAILSAENWAQLYIPAGFAHGFCTLEPNTEVLYKVSAPYAPEHDSGLLWNDPNLNLPWPNVAELGVNAPTLSEKDSALQSFAQFQSQFTYKGA